MSGLSMMLIGVGLCLFVSACLMAGPVSAEPRTTFQIHVPWKPNLDFQSDCAIVYGVDESFESRLRSWKQQGYSTEMMTGAAWGNYQDYVDGRFDGKNHLDDAQVRRDGTKVMHDASTPYFVPSRAYRDYLKTKLAKAIDAGASAIYLEEPEFWAFAGYSQGFQREYKSAYQQDWRPPHESVTARYRADQLKYILYRDTLEELFRFCKDYARQKGTSVRCYVPTHSLISYSYIQMVSPMSSLMALPDADGYIAQVWTGTARAPNTYRGITKERTFEMAYFEYAQMIAMTRPTGRTCYLLCDPIEDDPNHGWDDYEANYKRTLVASLMQPEATHFEVMPWPNRIFEAGYFATEAEARRRDDKTNPPARVPIPKDYTTVLLTCFNTLADMDPKADVSWDASMQGIGVLVSDSLMFQRVSPAPSDKHLGNFFGLAMPLLKRGAAVKVVQMETLTDASAVKDIHVLVMTYEGMKPMKPDYHQIIADWVKAGGALVLIDDWKDPYNSVESWWNTRGKHYAHPGEHLMEALGVRLKEGMNSCGQGRVIYKAKSPAALSRANDGDRQLIELVQSALPLKNWREQSKLILHRGSYVAAAVMDESVSDQPAELKGQFVDLFDSTLPVLVDPKLKVGSVSLLRNPAKQKAPAVVASSSRIRDQQGANQSFIFTSRGPANTDAVTRILLPLRPNSVRVLDGQKPIDAKWDWDESSHTLLLRHENLARRLTVSCQW